MIGVICLAMGCADNQPDARFYSGSLSADNLPGVWIIEPQSLPTLGALGFVQFTNQLDHVLLLNNDGTCVYRGFDDYAIPALWFNRSEVDQHEGFLREGSRMWPDGVPDAKSWYTWAPSTSSMISGPYEKTNETGFTSSVLCKNRWTRWRLQDGRTKASAGFQDIFGAMYRYRICLSHPTFNAETFFLIGKDEHGLFLWKPVVDRMDGTSLLEKMIRFRKWSAVLSAK